MQIDLSDKQSEAWNYLEGNPVISDVFYGGGAGCFSHDTLVNTSKGYIPISSIKIGDSVLSYNTNTNVFEYKKVLKTFTHNANRQSKKFVIFTFKNTQLKCTDNHEFYFRGTWNRADSIAKRTLDVCSQHRKPLPSIEHGAVNNNGLQGVKTHNHNEARVRPERLPSDDAEDKRETKDYQDTPHCGSNMDCESKEQTTSKPFKRYKDRQHGRKPRMVNGFGKHETRLRKRISEASNMYRTSKRFKGWNEQTNRITSYRDKKEVQTARLYSKDVRGGIRGFTSYNKGRDTKELEARFCRIEQSNELTYDLCVEDNHNYCVTTEDIIAHNSGKSWFGCVWHIYRRATYAGSRGMIGRSKIKALEQSTLITLFEVATLMGYEAGKDYVYNSQKNIIKWNNGSVTILKDLFLYPSDPDFASLGSTEYTDVFIDEVTEITAKAYDIVNSRIRYKLDDYGLTPKILTTGNPKKNWVKKKFVDPKELPKHIRFIQALLTDNPNEKFKELYDQQLSRMSSEYDKARLLYGDWDADEEIENPFAFNFDEKIHVKPCHHLENQRLIISMDFNIEPFGFIFSHVWQDKQGWHCHIFMESTIKEGDITKAIEDIRGKFHHYLPNCIVTGDYNGNKREISQVNNASLFDMVRLALRLSHKQMQATPNPRHKNSRTDLNYVLHHSQGIAHDIDFRVDPSCVNTIRDLRFVEADGEGTIIKSNRKNLHEQADHLDAVRYLIQHKSVQDYLKFRRKLYI